MLNRSKQHRLPGGSVGARRRPRLVSSTRGSSGAVRSGSRRRLRSPRRSSGTGRCPWGRLAQEAVGVLVRSPLPRAVGVSATLEQHCRPPVHRELGLELTDPPSGCHQLGLVRRGQAGLEAPVDAILSPPRVDRLVADTRIGRDLGDLRPVSIRSRTRHRNSGGYLPLVPVTAELEASTREALSSNGIQVVPVDSSATGSAPVVDLFTWVLGPPGVSAGHLLLWLTRTT